MPTGLPSRGPQSQDPDSDNLTVISWPHYLCCFAATQEDKMRVVPCGTRGFLEVVWQVYLYPTWEDFSEPWTAGVLDPFVASETFHRMESSEPLIVNISFHCL